MSIAVVMAALNEEQAIGSVLDEIHRALEHCEFAIVVVDGRSTDRTVEIAKSRGAHVVRQRGKGYGDALSLGFQYAAETFDPETFVMIDADGTYAAEDIPRLVEPILNDQADMVIGNRFARMQPGAMTFLNKVGNQTISWLSRHLLGLRVSDTQCGLRAFAPEVGYIFNGHANGMSFATEMLADASQVSVRISEVPITYRPRIGKTKLNPLRDGANILAIIVRLLRDYRPLLFFGSIAFVFVLLGLLLGFEVITEWLLTGGITKVPTAVLTVLLIGVGVQFFSLGLVADMIKGLRSGRRTQFNRNGLGQKMNNEVNDSRFRLSRSPARKERQS